MGIHLSTATARTLQDKRAVKLNEYYNIDIGYSQAAYLWITDRLFSPVFHYTAFTIIRNAFHQFVYFFRFCSQIFYN